MEKRLVKYPSIGQFRNIVREVTDRAKWKFKGEDGNPVYYTNPTEYTIPTLKFKGKVKLHGTNASVAFNEANGYYVQSRKNILSVEKDNYGFTQFMMFQVGTEILDEIFKPLKDIVDTSENTIVLYGEFCGGSLQKGVALNALDKMFVMFGIKIRPHDETIQSYWLNFDDDALGLMRDFHTNVHNVNKFGTWTIDIDFNDPASSQNELVELTLEVEEECPVGRYFGLVKGKDNTTGEGIVWAAMTCKIIVHDGRIHINGNEASQELSDALTEKLNDGTYHFTL